MLNTCFCYHFYICAGKISKILFLFLFFFFFFFWNDGVNNIHLYSQIQNNVEAYFMSAFKMIKGSIN